MTNRRPLTDAAVEKENRELVSRVAAYSTYSLEAYLVFYRMSLPLRVAKIEL
jgi:hypothetical protein